MMRAFSKKLCGWCWVVLAGLIGASAGLCEPREELKGDHFIVFFEKDDEPFARDVLRSSEEYYRTIAADLGYARYSNFWQWDNRVKIFIYADQESFRKAKAQPSWSTGFADYDNKEISGFFDNMEFLKSVLPHEIAHLIFRDYVGFKGEVPLWLDEGVAQWQEEAKRQAYKYFVRQLFDQKQLMPLDQLTKTDVRLVPQDNSAMNFYIQAAALIGFLIERYGSDSFIAFCRQLRDGKSLDESLTFAYPTQIRSLDDLEERWLKDVSRIDIVVPQDTKEKQDALVSKIR